MGARRLVQRLYPNLMPARDSSADMLDAMCEIVERLEHCIDVRDREIDALHSRPSTPERSHAPSAPVSAPPLRSNSRNQHHPNDAASTDNTVVLNTTTTTVTDEVVYVYTPLGVPSMSPQRLAEVAQSLRVQPPPMAPFHAPMQPAVSATFTAPPVAYHAPPV